MFLARADCLILRYNVGERTEWGWGVSKDESVQTDESLIAQRKAGLQQFHEALIPDLVDFVAAMGIQPAHWVLNQADQYTGSLSMALQNMDISGGESRVYLIHRLGAFIGEYFTQKCAGAWYVNDIPGSRYYARYVVGHFSQLNHPTLMLDPFEIAADFADAACPRNLVQLLDEVDQELIKFAQ